MSEQQEEKITISVFEFAIIHNALAETYNSFKNKLETGNYGELTEEQVNYACHHLYETFLKVDKLLEPHSEALKNFGKKPEEECKQVIPNTFIMCGEGVGEEKQYCSDVCYKKAKEKENGSME